MYLVYVTGRFRCSSRTSRFLVTLFACGDLSSFTCHEKCVRKFSWRQMMSEVHRRRNFSIQFVSKSRDFYFYLFASSSMAQHTRIVLLALQPAPSCAHFHFWFPLLHWIQLAACMCRSSAFISPLASYVSIAKFLYFFLVLQIYAVAICAFFFSYYFYDSMAVSALTVWWTCRLKAQFRRASHL
jgi:hypothetical protein